MSSPTLSESITNARSNKTVSTVVLVVLIAILTVLYFTSTKMKGMILVLIAICVTALGINVFDYDLDLETLRDTGSIAESRVENKNGVKLIGKCISDNINCKNFNTQIEAQTLYDTCSAKNNGKDVYGLDGDKDGKVCESLPK